MKGKKNFPLSSPSPSSCVKKFPPRLESPKRVSEKGGRAKRKKKKKKKKVNNRGGEGTFHMD